MVASHISQRCFSIHRMRKVTEDQFMDKTSGASVCMYKTLGARAVQQSDKIAYDASAGF